MEAYYLHTILKWKRGFALYNVFILYKLLEETHRKLKNIWYCFIFTQIAHAQRNVSQFAFFSVLVCLRSCETSVVAQVLFQFKVRIRPSTVVKPGSVLDAFLNWPKYRACIDGDLCGFGIGLDDYGKNNNHDYFD